MRMCNAMFIIKADIHVCHKFVMDISTNLKCINQIEWHSMMKKLCLGKPSKKTCVFYDIGLKGGWVPVSKHNFFYIRN